jgi:hypothetical protein
MSTYQYSSLARGQFRVINLAPGTNSKLRARLEVVEGLQQCEYEAVSYCWGSAKLTQELVMHDGTNLKITDSAYGLLRHLRHSDKPRRLWVDQICINQTNVAEKSEQVKEMHKVYKHTARLIIWLGEDDDESNQAMAILHNVFSRLERDGPLGFSHDQILTEVPLTANSSGCLEMWPWEKVARLLSRPWFTRMWVSR